MKPEFSGGASPCDLPVAGGPSTPGGRKCQPTLRKPKQLELAEAGGTAPIGASRGPKGWVPWKQKPQKRRANLGLVTVMFEVLEALGAPSELLACFHDATLHRIKKRELRARARAILSSAAAETSDVQ